jgi:hypothetical protein
MLLLIEIRCASTQRGSSTIARPPLFDRGGLRNNFEVVVAVGSINGMDVYENLTAQIETIRLVSHLQPYGRTMNDM